MNATKHLMNDKQLAELLGYSPQSVRRLRMLGEGPPFIKLGKSRGAPVRYHPDDVNEWLQSNRATALRDVRKNWRRG